MNRAFKLAQPSDRSVLLRAGVSVKRQQFPLLEQTAIVTGASRGIGLAIARRLVDDGARVIITARNQADLEDAADTFPANSVFPIAGKADDPEHRADVYRTVIEQFGHLDILVNNAGINPSYGALADLDLDAARKILEVNVLGTLAWVQAALRHQTLGFVDRGGSIINVSSVTGETPSPGIGMYGVSKAAVSHLTRSLAVELAPAIRVNAVAPAVVKTRFAAALYESNEQVVAAEYPLGRLGVPEDVAHAVAFLASPDASWITGQVIRLDGGLLTRGGRA